MGTLTPPVTLETPDNQLHVDYIQEVSIQPDFDYPPVSVHFVLVRLLNYFYMIVRSA